MLLLGSMRFAITALIGCVTCVFATGHAHALTSSELLQSCEAVDQTAEAGDGNSVDISSAGLPCWYYMSAAQNMSSLVDEANQRLLHICPPSDSTVLDFVHVFVQYARGTNVAVENPAALVFNALIKAYPCGEHP
jgi:Rap1a immunity proteins